MGIDTLQIIKLLGQQLKSWVYLYCILFFCLIQINQGLATSQNAQPQNAQSQNAQSQNAQSQNAQSQNAQSLKSDYQYLCLFLKTSVSIKDDQSFKKCEAVLDKQIFFIQPDSILQGLKNLFKDQPKMYGVKPQHTSEMRNRRKLAIENRVDQGENQGENQGESETEIEDEKEKNEKQEKQENLEEREKRAERTERLGQFVAFLNEQVILDLLQSNLFIKNTNIKTDHLSFYQLNFIRYSYAPRSPPVQLI